MATNLSQRGTGHLPLPLRSPFGLMWSRYPPNARMAWLLSGLGGGGGLGAGFSFVLHSHGLSHLPGGAGGAVSEPEPKRHQPVGPRHPTSNVPNSLIRNGDATKPGRARLGMTLEPLLCFLCSISGRYLLEYIIGTQWGCRW